MYTSHYGLTNKPFQISSDVTFMWLGEKHKEALATLRYGILDNKGFLLLTGDVGTGKTTLINTLIGSLDDDVIYASVPDPSLEKLDFFNYIGAAFGIGTEFDSKGKFLSSFSRFLNKAFENNQKVLLIIDEAQLLTQELLEEIRLLSNIVTKDSNPLLNIFLVGQYEFNTLIVRPENRAIAQRITLNYYIEPLTLSETGEYIRHRLKIAGTTEQIFDPSAIKEIYAFSKGFPRKINIICDHCLMSGYAEEQKTITGSIVKDSAKDLRIPEDNRLRANHEVAAAMPLPRPLMPGSPKQPNDPSNQGLGPTQLSQPSKTMKEPFLWSAGGLLSIVFGSILISLLFLYFTNTTFKETTTYFSMIQERIGFGSPESSGENSNAVAQEKTTVVENQVLPKSNPIPDAALLKKTITSPENAQQTKSSTAELSENAKQSKIVLHAREAGEQSAGPEVSIIASADAEPVNVQPLSKAEKSDRQDLPKKSVESVPSPLPEKMLVIRFKYDSNVFSVSDIDRMKEFARAVRSHPDANINVAGFTDSSGDAIYNKKLSEFRANMVKSFLMGQDLPPEQIRAQGYGNKNPVDSNDTEQGRMMNRRVEISVVAKS